MSGPRLQRFQADFAAALASSDPAAHPKGLTGEAADRFSVYRNNFYHKAPLKMPSGALNRLESGRRDTGIRGTSDGPNGLF